MRHRNNLISEDFVNKSFRKRWVH